MPPARRKGGKGAKEKRKLSVGDLVLAKVKGFPAWPAKISKPENWKRCPDPRKYFVEFFGTAEIAFVAPIDIQVFTSESKNKLYDRCRGKKVKNFTRAVEEICEAFEKLHGGGSVETGSDIERSATCLRSSKANGSDDSKVLDQQEMSHEDEIVERKGKISSAFSNDESSGLERCSQNRDGDASAGMGKMTSPNKDSSGLSTKTKEKTSHSDAQLPKEGALKHPKGAFHPGEEPHASPFKDVKKETCEFPVDDVQHTSNVALATGNHNHCDGPKLRCGLGSECAGSQLVTSSQTKKSNTSRRNDDDGTISVFSESKGKENSRTGPKRQVSKYLDKASPKEHLELSKSQPKIEEQEDGETSTSSDNDAKSSSSDTSDRIKKRRKHATNLSKYSSRLDRLPRGQKVKKDISEQERKRSSYSGGCGRKPVEDKKRKVPAAEEPFSNKRSKSNANEGNDTLMKPKKTDLSRIGSTDSKGVNLPKKKGSPFPSNEEEKISDSPAKVDNPRSKSIKNEKGPAFSVKGDISSKVDSCKVGTHSATSKTALPSSVRRDSIFKAVSGTSKSSGTISNKLPEAHKRMRPNSASKISPVSHPPKRRTFRLEEDDDEEEDPRTPVHGRSASALPKVGSGIPVTVRKLSAEDAPMENPDNEGCKGKPSSDSVSSNDLPIPSEQVEETVKEKIAEVQVSASPGKLEHLQSFCKDEKPGRSPKKPLDGGNDAKAADPRSFKLQGKLSAVSSTKRAHVGSLKPRSGTPNHERSFETLTIRKVNPSFLKEKSKDNKKVDLPVFAPENRADTNVSAEQSLEKDFLLMDRLLENSDIPCSSSLESSKFSDSATSMKQLIAAAQAKMKQGHLHHHSHNDVTGFISTSVIQGISPQSPVHFAHENNTQKDAGEFHPSRSLGSPNARAAYNQVGLEEYENKVSPEAEPPVGSLSGGTEAAVARDALEGMIETLSRTKDSIGRATRLAIDCAKYGIAGEVVELLIRKLESEASFHRRVDLFFLVDSITQCSHSQKGIASASYVPVVQAALSRLLGVAAPPGSGARENRRQCLKVLKIWIDRKIMPESVLRRCIDDIEAPNDDSTSGIFLRRPSRAERSIDDPIREMEGILVDEYGSNATTFQLPVLLSSNIFEDEEDLPITSSKDVCEFPEAGSAFEEPDACGVTPSRHPCILEDVDGELEMEDVCLSSKEERIQAGINASKSESGKYSSQINAELTTSNQNELACSPAGSPPMPLDAPPSPPPLPPSPPPPPTPPPPSSPSPFPPPPPPLPSSLPPPLPPQPNVSSSPLVYQAPLPQEYLGTPSSNQIVQMVGSTPVHGHNNASMVEPVLQPPPNFVASALCSGPPMPSSFNSSRSSEYGNGEVYLTPLSSLHHHQFQPVGAAFQQRPYCSISPAQAPSNLPLPTGQAPLNHRMPPQTPSNHFPYVKPVIQQHMHQPYLAYSLPTHLNGRRQSSMDEQWRPNCSDFSPDNQHGSWAAGGRSSTGVPFIQDGFLRSNMERQCSNSMGFPLTLHASMTSGAPLPGHGGAPSIPCKPDGSALNCWRPG